nr:unnamed protein product [Callosobruchus analis]
MFRTPKAKNGIPRYHLGHQKRHHLTAVTEINFSSPRNYNHIEKAPMELVSSEKTPGEAEFCLQRDTARATARPSFTEVQCTATRMLPKKTISDCSNCAGRMQLVAKELEISSHNVSKERRFS